MAVMFGLVDNFQTLRFFITETLFGVDRRFYLFFNKMINEDYLGLQKNIKYLKNLNSGIILRNGP
jgi:hypothetical protein